MRYPRVCLHSCLQICPGPWDTRAQAMQETAPVPEGSTLPLRAKLKSKKRQDIFMFKKVFEIFFEICCSIDNDVKNSDTTTTASKRRNKNGAKTVQNGPKTARKSLENVLKIACFHMGALLRIVLKFPD